MHLKTGVSNSEASHLGPSLSTSVSLGLDSLVLARERAKLTDNGPTRSPLVKVSMELSESIISTILGFS